MKGWILLVDSQKAADRLSEAAKDWPSEQGTLDRFSVVTTREYLANPSSFRGMRPKVINLSRSYRYQSRGYYCSLLAEARGHRVVPTVETAIEIDDRMLYARSLPELEASIKSCLKPEEKDKRAEAPDVSLPSRLLVLFGQVEDKRFSRFGRLLFDWFRSPIVEVRFQRSGESEIATIPRIKKVGVRAVTKLTEAELVFFGAALSKYTQRQWQSPVAKTAPRYSFATLINPSDEMPPSTRETLRHWARIAEKMGVEVEPITKKDLVRLAEFDALFIRETTSIDNHTYRFARRAAQEGMPVIDDPVSMIRCTNKVYLQELLVSNGVPVPPSIIISGKDDLERVADELGFPVVVKIPDSSFSRGVKKVGNADELKALVKAWLKDSDLILAQQFMPTTFDWRVGVLGGRPLFVSQYKMARAHWQIVKHRPDGKAIEGGFNTPKLSAAPPEVIDVGLRAATLMGDGLYGVDLKETPSGVVVIEVNDNPNLDHGVEDLGEKNAVWRSLTQWFIDRLDG